MEYIIEKEELKDKTDDITFTIKYNSHGGVGNMYETKVNYGECTRLRENQFTKIGYIFLGWYAYRMSDDKWRYTNGDKRGWYKIGRQPIGYKRYIYRNKGKVSTTSRVDNDTVIMYAVWKRNKIILL